MCDHDARCKFVGALDHRRMRDDAWRERRICAGGFRTNCLWTAVRGRIMNYPANRAKLEFPGKDEESPKLWFVLRIRTWVLWVKFTLANGIWYFTFKKLRILHTPCQNTQVRIPNTNPNFGGFSNFAGEFQLCPIGRIIHDSPSYPYLACSILLILEYWVLYLWRVPKLDIFGFV